MTSDSALPCGCVIGRLGDFPTGRDGVLHGLRPAVQPAAVHGTCALPCALAFSQGAGEREGAARGGRSGSLNQRARWPRVAEVQLGGRSMLLFSLMKTKLGWVYFYT